jgi:hypothetical protein
MSMNRQLKVAQMIAIFMAIAWVVNVVAFLGFQVRSVKTEFLVPINVAFKDIVRMGPVHAIQVLRALIAVIEGAQTGAQIMVLASIPCAFAMKATQLLIAL